MAKKTAAYKPHEGPHKRNIYVAGPMRGIPYFNNEAFFDAELTLADAEWNVFNPARRDLIKYGQAVFESPEGRLADIASVVPDFTLREALGADLDWIAKYADAIYLLNGWENSKGALAEKALAEALGLDVMYEENEHQTPPWEDETGADVEAEYAARFYTTGEGAPPDERFVVTARSGDTITVKHNAPSGEVRVTSSTGGEKGSKLARFDLIPIGPLTTLATLYGKGAEKYADRNWERGYDWSLSYAALMRHVTAFWGGQNLDPEHGLPHLASVAWHAFALMEYAETHPEFDNRPY